MNAGYWSDRNQTERRKLWLKIGKQMKKQVERLEQLEAKLLASNTKAANPDKQWKR